VAEFRTTLFWPLTLHLREHGDNGDTLSLFSEEALAKQLDAEICRLKAGGSWDPVPDLLDHIPASIRPNKDAADTYAEFTYFHEFVQQFLFASDPSEAPLRLFRRSGIASVVAQYRKGGKPWRAYELAVERLNLYVAKAGIAILVIELAMPQERHVHAARPGTTEDWKPGSTDWESRTATLEDVQFVNDSLRRAHAPYLKQEQPEQDGPFQALDIIPHCVVWRDTAGAALNQDPAKTCSAAPVRPENALREAAAEARAIPPFTHLAWLLSKKEGAGWRIGPPLLEGGGWNHTADDRLPLITAIRLVERDETGARFYDRIGLGDWVRLCFVDGPDDAPMPYAREFALRDWQDHAYDRFHYAAADSPLAPSRFLLCGYALTAVGSGDFFKDHLIHHMRRHYFQLMLLAQIERAVLLAISGRISAAVRRHDRLLARGRRASADRLLEPAVQDLQSAFLGYVHRFRFTGVSGQLQAGELHARLRDRMHLQTLYADVRDELAAATQFLALRTTQREAGHAAWLSTVATFGVIIALAFSLLGANVLDKNGVDGFLALFGAPAAAHAGRASLGIILLTVAGCAALGLLLSFVLGRQPGSQFGQRLRRILWWIVAAGGIAGALLLTSALPVAGLSGADG